MMPELTKKEELRLLHLALSAERASFIPVWRDSGEYILPRRTVFTPGDTNKGERRNLKIIDSTATLAARTLRSGMMMGITSPARPWFRLTTHDPDLAEFQPIREWLHTVTERMRTVMLRSNLYNALPLIYGDIGVFATAALGIERTDDEDVFRCYPFPIGSYMIANNDRMKVDIFFRELKLTVRQLLQKFGDGRNTDWSKFSIQVRNCYDRAQYDVWIDVYHVIRPNPDYVVDNPFSKKYEDLYYEVTEQNEERYLRQGGFDYFPVLCPRWEVTGGDVYGTECPGIQVIGDVKALQLMQKRKAQAIEKMVNPPMVAPVSMRNQKATILPGDISYVDEREGQKGFRPAHEVKLSVGELQMSIQEHQERIKRAFYEDLFLMLTTLDRRQITAREIEERHEEKLLTLGPVLEQLNQDLLDPLIDIVFDMMYQGGMIPEPPVELQGMPLKVEYISIMSQAQKLIGISGIERFAGFVGSLAKADPTVLDRIDLDRMVDVYGDLTSVDPSIVRADDVVMEMRQARAEEAERQRQAEEMLKMAETIKSLAGGVPVTMPESRAGELVEIAP